MRGDEDFQIELPNYEFHGFYKPFRPSRVEINSGFEAANVALHNQFNTLFWNAMSEFALEILALPSEKESDSLYSRLHFNLRATGDFGLVYKFRNWQMEAYCVQTAEEDLTLLNGKARRNAIASIKDRRNCVQLLKYSCEDEIVHQANELEQIITNHPFSSILESKMCLFLDSYAQRETGERNAVARNILQISNALQDFDMSAKLSELGKKEQVVIRDLASLSVQELGELFLGKTLAYNRAEALKRFKNHAILNKTYQKIDWSLYS